MFSTGYPEKKILTIFRIFEKTLDITLREKCPNAEKTDQKNSEYGHFSRSVKRTLFHKSQTFIKKAHGKKKTFKKSFVFKL